MLKLLFSLLILRIRPHLGLLDAVLSRFRVMPWDLDANVHMNNVQYLKYFEKGRIEHLIRTPAFAAQYRHGAHCLIINTEVTYLKSLMPFQAFDVCTRLSSWDDRYVYFDQRIEARGEVYAIAVIRMAMLHQKKGHRLSPLSVFERYLKGRPVPSLPASAIKLNELVQAQRAESAAPMPPAPLESAPQTH